MKKMYKLYEKKLRGIFTRVRWKSTNPNYEKYDPTYTLCKEWDSPDKFDNFYNWAIDKYSKGKVFQSYNKHYSPETCYFGTLSNKSKKCAAKVMATHKKNHGAHYLSTKKGRQAIKQTCIKKYRVEHHSKSNKIKEKTKQTNIIRYDVENPGQNPEIKRKIKRAHAKYEGGHPLRDPAVQAERVKRYKNKTGFDYPMQNPEVVAKSKATTLKNHGVPYIVQKYPPQPKKLFNGKSVSELAKGRDLAYSSMLQRLSKHPFDVAINTDKRQSLLERTVFSMLQKYTNNIIQQAPFHSKIGNVTVKRFSDFYLPDYNLIIECDGLYWHCDKIIKNKKHHFDRKNYYNSLGIKSLFFREDEIHNKLDIIESIIKHKMGLSKTIGARTLNIDTCDEDFFVKNHIMGKHTGTIISLNNQDETLCAIQYHRRRDDIKIQRMCNKLNTAVIGGLSKLINYIWKTEPKNKMTSMVDCRYGDGHSLINIGFKQLTHKESFKWTDFENSFYRGRYKSNTGYKHGLYKIWDCGQKNFELKRNKHAI